jgi:hypothetical protein
MSGTLLKVTSQDSRIPGFDVLFRNSNSCCLSVLECILNMHVVQVSYYFPPFSCTCISALCFLMFLLCPTTYCIWPCLPLCPGYTVTVRYHCAHFFLLLVVMSSYFLAWAPYVLVDSYYSVFMSSIKNEIKSFIRLRQSKNTEKIKRSIICIKTVLSWRTKKNGIAVFAGTPRE